MLGTILTFIKSMKFTEQQAYEELVKQMTKRGETLQISERTMKAMIKKYCNKFANEETELADFVKDNIDDFKEVDGQVRKDNSDFVKKFKSENPTNKEGGKTEEEPTPVNPELTALLDKLNGLEAKLMQKEKEDALKNKRTDLAKALKEKGVKDEKWLRAYLPKIHISEETDIDAEAESGLEFFNLSRINRDPNVTPCESNGGNKAGNVDFSDVAALIKRQRGEN